VRLKLVNLLTMMGVASHLLACLWLAVSRTTAEKRSWTFEYRDGMEDDGELML
jgi:hypothetical protein